MFVGNIYLNKPDTNNNIESNVAIKEVIEEDNSLNIDDIIIDEVVENNSEIRCSIFDSN